MTSQELANHVSGHLPGRNITSLATARVLGIGKDQYTDDDETQRFESKSMSWVMTELMEELADALVYMTMYLILRQRAGILVSPGVQLADRLFMQHLDGLYQLARLRADRGDS